MVKVVGVGVMVEVGLHGFDLDLYMLSDAVHIGSGFLVDGKFWREGGWEERRDPARKMDARRLMQVSLSHLLLCSS
jgi:hypothetical protein